MAGGKGGKQTSETTIPQYIEDAARRNLSKADAIAATGYVPEYGPSVAAFTPMQEAGFQNTADAASAFGLSGGNLSARDLRGGMDAPTTYAGGVRGYSSAPMYEDMLAQLEANAPGQYDYLRSFSIDPVTGEMGSRAAPAPAPVQGTNLGGINLGGELEDNDVFSYSGGGGSPYTSFSTLQSYLPGGVNTRNPESFLNQTIAGLGQPQGSPTAASRPAARPTRGVS
jgi:hypothetical protein